MFPFKIPPGARTLCIVAALLGLALLGHTPPPATAEPAAVAADDLRLSTMGPDGNTNYYALDPAVAYNSTGDEYLVVWAADDDTGSLVDNEFEIYGQRVAGSTGSPAGGRIRISTMGPDGDPGYYARNPAVAYNSTANEYLVVWASDDDTAPLADDEFEIYGQRLAADGALLGARFRLSDMGPDGDPAFDALNPAVAYNGDDDEYLVVWQGDDAADNVVEIYGQRISAAGAEIGTDLAVSDMGTDPADGRFRGQDPAVAYNSSAGEYLVVWEGDDDTAPLVDDEIEIFGQRLAGSTGNLAGGRIRLSDMGPDGSTAYAADNPSVAYNSTAGEYLVVWSGDDDTTPLADGEFEVYGQRLAAGGSEIAPNDFRISDMGPDGDPAYKTFGARAAYVPTRDAYLVVWRGDDDRDFGGGALADDEMEIFGQWLDTAGTPLGDNDLRLSDMGDTDGDPEFDADRPALAASTVGDMPLVAWQGDDEVGTLVEGEVEIFCDTPAAPTAVDLVLFQARPAGGGILLEWETAAELDNLGFNLHRAGEPDGPRLQINPSLIPAANPGTPAGARYDFLDQAVAPGEDYYYWLEAVDVAGLSTFHGPVRATTAVQRLFLPLIHK